MYEVLNLNCLASDFTAGYRYSNNYRRYTKCRYEKVFRAEKNLAG